MEDHEYVYEYTEESGSSWGSSWDLEERPSFRERQPGSPSAVPSVALLEASNDNSASDNMPATSHQPLAGSPEEKKAQLGMCHVSSPFSSLPPHTIAHH